MHNSTPYNNQIILEENNEIKNAEQTTYNFEEGKMDELVRHVSLKHVGFITRAHCSGLTLIFNRYIDTQASPVPDEAHIEMYNSKRLVDGNQGQPTTLSVASMQCSVLKPSDIQVLNAIVL